MPTTSVKSGDRKEQVVVRLDSRAPEANAAAVASSMSAVLALVSEAHAAIGDNQELLVKARPFAEGSFEIPLELIAVGVGAMFASSPLLDNILDAIRRYFEIKRELQGDAIVRKDAQTIIVKGNEVNVGSIVINLLDPRSLANREVSKALHEVDADESISGIELIRGAEQTPFVAVQKSEFPYFKLPDTIDDPTKRRQSRSRETLGIASPVFEGDAKWRFNRRGNIIAASIADEAFLERVKRQVEAFVAGDRLDVDLVIDQLDELGVGGYVDKAYTIERVWHHEKQKKQKKFTEDDE